LTIRSFLEAAFVVRTELTVVFVVIITGISKLICTGVSNIIGTGVSMVMGTGVSSPTVAVVVDDGDDVDGDDGDGDDVVGVEDVVAGAGQVAVYFTAES